MGEPNNDTVRILFIEDDFIYAEYFAELLAETFQDVAITLVETESALLASVDDLANDPPDIIITDMRLRWTDLSGSAENMPPDHDVMFGGARCIKAIRERDTLAYVPVLIVTALTSQRYQEHLPDPPRNIESLTKPVMPERLIAVVRSQLAAHVRPPGLRKKGLASRVWEAMDFAPGIGGMKVNIKKLLK